jgi:hypothetical protein
MNAPLIKNYRNPKLEIQMFQTPSRNRVAVPADPLSNLRDSLAAAERDLAVVGEALGSAALEALEQPKDGAAQKKRDEASQAVAAARDRVAAIHAAIQTGASREAAKAAKDAAADLARRWALVESQCAVRAKAAQDVESAAVAMAKAWSALEAATSAIAATQLAHDQDGAMLRRSDVEVAMRLGVAKAGNFRWASAGWPWSIDALPALSSRIVAANDHLMNQKGSQ